MVELELELELELDDVRFNWLRFQFKCDGR